uniref:Uncharacterized protein n=1 Tax=Rhizophora mucronata TaxID=61149 RepID=A0A2P2ISD4_RHIMU
MLFSLRFHAHNLSLLSPQVFRFTASFSQGKLRSQGLSSLFTLPELSITVSHLCQPCFLSLKATSLCKFVLPSQGFLVSLRCPLHPSEGTNTKFLVFLLLQPTLTSFSPLSRANKSRSKSLINSGSISGLQFISSIYILGSGREVS